RDRPGGRAARRRADASRLTQARPEACRSVPPHRRSGDGGAETAADGAGGGERGRRAGDGRPGSGRTQDAHDPDRARRHDHGVRGAGGGAGKAKVADVEVLKDIDDQTLAILKDVFNGTHETTVTVVLFDPGATTTLATFTFTTVSFTESGQTGGDDLEHVKFV